MINFLQARAWQKNSFQQMSILLHQEARLLKAVWTIGQRYSAAALLSVTL
jgi:hypothetical protein